jgi:hypothetical protein
MSVSGNIDLAGYSPYVTQIQQAQGAAAGGGTTPSADPLFNLLGSNTTGSVGTQPASQTLPGAAYSDEVGAQLIADQSQQSSGNTGQDALLGLLDGTTTSSNTAASADSNSAQDALWSLLEGTTSMSGTATSGTIGSTTDPTSTTPSNQALDAYTQANQAALANLYANGGALI